MKFLEIILDQKRSLKDKNEPKSDIDRYLELSNTVKDARANRKLTQEDLSRISKIPLFIIIAIENNEKELIPEDPFLRSILIKLEECLLIKKFKLVNLVKEEKTSKNEKVQFNYLINKFDLINSWRGNLIYILLLLLSLLILNNYFINTRTIEFKFIEKNIQK
tara:strand:+ start:168 stop:656 length:489 start_codon:yes stop_codon:yes gene_type:complete